jgi:threonine aldolase
MTRPIELRSDNAAGVAPELMQAIAAANVGSALAYGDDEITHRLRDTVAEVFEHPDVMVYPVTSGTAANSLALSAMVPSWGSVLCHDSAHILRSECGATSMFGGGAVMAGLPGPDYRLTPDAVEAAFAATRWGDPHHSQPSVVSLTCPTDHGTVYSVDEVAAIAAVARSSGLRVHIDGARLANAIAALGCSPADLTWRAGVDVFSLGGIKNGTMNADAIVCFDPSLAESLKYRVKRSGHVASKMRYQSAQLQRYLTGGLWLQLAARANHAMAALADGLSELGVRLLNDVQANMVFAELPAAAIDRLLADDVLFYRMGETTIRLVTSFQTSDDDVADALHRFSQALAAN